MDHCRFADRGVDAAAGAKIENLFTSTASATAVSSATEAGCDGSDWQTFPIRSG